MPKNIVTIQSIDQPQLMEHWGSLTDVCANHSEFDYAKLRKLKFPFDHKGFRFTKIEYKQINIIKNPFI